MVKDCFTEGLGGLPDWGEAAVEKKTPSRLAVPGMPTNPSLRCNLVVVRNKVKSSVCIYYLKGIVLLSYRVRVSSGCQDPACQNVKIKRDFECA
jgi:hypothetical protein